MHLYTLKSERQIHGATRARLRKRLACTLSILLIWQPVLLAAEPISPTHGTTGRPTLDQAANGVPVINIQNPNSSGVSQNFYHDFNVDNRGVIFNNSKQMTQTQLGGYIEGNPNLRGGTARLILNEVIGTDPSLLNGYMEVGGRRADVVLANPNGITCNGCGFINTSYATLTTGTPIMDGGTLNGFNVQGGQINIDEGGLNGANTERFDLIARSVRLAGALHANELNVVTGKQQVDRQTLAITNAGTDGDRPTFAIDSSALGGMYANRIRLIANEGGVGVRLDAPVAAQSGDLSLLANGRIQYTDMAATGDISVTANNYDVVGTGTVQGLSDITINADSYDNSGAVVAEGVAAVRADQVSNSGTLGGREALRITADVINNDEGGALLSGGDITLEANEVTNRLADIYAVGDIDITARDGGEAEQLENRSGRIEARGDLTIKAQEIWNVRDFLEWQEVMTGGNAVYECIECRRSRFSMRYIFTEQFHRELDEKTTGRSLLISGSDMALVGDSIVNETSDILSFGDIDLDVGRVDNLGLHSGDYEIVNRYVQEIRSWIHVGLVENGIQPYNTRNYYGGTEYWGGGKNKALEYMRLLPDAVNSNYDPDNLLAREDNLIHKNLYHAGEQLKILESTNILGANIISGGNLDMNEAALYNGDVGHREQENFTEEELIAVRDSTGNASSYDDYLVGVNGGLFSVADPEHPYLIETNPFFATADGLLGSEYLLNRLDWDPDGAMRLLGDGYYEQQLVREQIIELTGRVFLSDQYADANAQYKALLDNGAFAAESLKLAVGVALTADQVNRLTTDIVWMVEKEVAGETVLVPQVFLAPNSKVIENSGTLVASGGDMFINDGSVLNTGTVHFGGDAIFTLDEAGLQNLGGDITGDGALIVESEGEIRNVSGTISAREVALRSATEINNLRFHRLNELSAGGTREWDTDTGRAGVISGSESLSLDSAGDINIVGSKLDGGEIVLDADGNIVIGTVEVKEGREGNYHGGYLSESSVRHLGSEINATLGLIANAANDLSLIGSDLNSDGDVQISASNDVRIASVENSSSYNFLVRHDGETSHNIKRNVQQRGATISGKGNVTIVSGNNLTTIASNLLADGDLSLMAKGDLSLLSANNAEYRYSYSEDDGSFGRSRTATTETNRENVVGTQLVAKGDVLINAAKDKQGRLVGYEGAKGDVILTAADVQSEGDIFIASAGNLTLDSAANITSSESHKTKQGTVSARQSGQSSLSITHQGTNLGAVGDVQLMALGDITLENADTAAGGDLIVSAGLYSTKGETRTNDQAKLVVRDVHDIYLHDSYKKSSKADIGGMVASVATLGLGGGISTLNPFEFADVTKATVANGLNGEKGYSQASGRHSATSQGSHLGAEGSVLLQSASDILIQGSTVSGLRESEEGEFSVQGSTALLAGTVIDPRSGQTVLENGEADLFVVAGENRNSSYFEREEFGVDYLGAVGGALTQMAGVATGTFTGDYSGPDDLPDDISIKREGVERRTERVTLTQSVIQDSQSLKFSSGNDMTVVASQILSGGDMAFSAGGDVNFSAGIETLSDYRASYGNAFDSFIGGYDHGRLYAGIEGERYREESLLERGTALASLIQADGLVSMQVGGDVEVIGSELYAQGMDADIGGEMRFAAVQEYERSTEKSTVEKTSLTAGVGNSYVDAAYASDDFVKASENVKRAYDALQAAKEDPRVADLGDYEANLSLALLQQQAVGIQAATSISGAVENTPALGFYGDVKMSVETTEQSSSSEALTHRGSVVQLGASGMSLQGQAFTLQGSSLDIHEGGGLSLDVDRFTVEAVADVFTSQSHTETRTSNFTLASSSRSNLAGAAAVDALSGGLGGQSNEQQSQSRLWQYGALSVDGVLSLDVKDQTTVHGGDIWAREVKGTTGELVVSSLQNTSTSKDSSRGFNIGGGKGLSINGGYNTASSSSERGWVDQVSSFHGEDAFDLTVDGHTQLNGAVISSGNPAAFTLDTETFAYSDIHDYDRSSSSGWGISTSFNPLDLKAQQKAPEGSTTINAHRNGHDKEGITRATVGQGSIIVRDQDSDRNSDLASLNRDIDNTQQVTKDEITGGLDAEVTIDHRFLNETGREEIVKDLKSLPENITDYWRKTGGAVVENVAFELYALQNRLPDEHRALGRGMQGAYKDYLRRGGNPETFLAFMESESFRDAGVELLDMQKAIDSALAKGMTQEQLLSVLAACQGGCDPDNIRQVDVLGEIFSVSDEGSLGIDVFRQVAELDTAMRTVMSSLPVDEAVIGDAMLALGAIAAGPVRLGAEVLKSTLVGDYIDDASRTAKDYVSTAMAGAAHNADRESMAHVAGAEAGLYEALFDLTESLEGPVSSYSEEDRALYDSLNQSIALAEGIGDTLHGAQIVTDYVVAVMIGAGGGVTKSSSGDHKTGSDQRDHEVRGTDSESEARVTRKVGPKPNGGIAKKHGTTNHDNAINNRISQLQQDPGVTNIRKNQQQVDVNGNKVGTNRPDIQYDKDGCHHCVEYDHVNRNSVKHGQVIRQRDPTTKVELNRL